MPLGPFRRSQGRFGVQWAPPFLDVHLPLLAPVLFLSQPWSAQRWANFLIMGCPIQLAQLSYSDRRPGRQRKAGQRQNRSGRESEEAVAGLRDRQKILSMKNRS